jgi:hypothetical protein
MKFLGETAWYKFPLLIILKMNKEKMGNELPISVNRITHFYFHLLRFIVIWHQ